VNLYPEIATREGRPKTKAALVGRPGLTVFGALSNSPVRALWSGTGQLFGVGGSHFNQMNSGGGVAVDCGAFAGSTGTGPCQIVNNGNQTLVMDSSVSTGGQQTGDVFIVNLGAHTNTERFQGSALTYLDGFFVGLSSIPGDINKVYVSNLLDGNTWNALNFVQRTGASDLLVNLEVLNGLLWMFGEKSIEVWYDAGNPTFPFSRVQGATISLGLLQRFSVVKFYDTIMWIGADEKGYPRVYKSSGITPVPVSNPGVEYLIGAYAGNSSQAAICYGYEENGHVFYCINLSAANNIGGGTGTTVVYDLTTGLWHERNTGTGGSMGQMLTQCVASLPAFSGNGSFVYAGDFNSAYVYYQSTGNSSDNGAAINYIRRAPHLSEANLWTVYSAIEIDADIGAAQMQLDYSNDGGRTFPVAHRRGPQAASGAASAAYGSAGGGFGRFKFWQLGRSRDRVFQASISSSTEHVRLIGANLQVEAGLDG
jgi:hypothetical protein